MKHGGTNKTSTNYFLDRMAQASRKRVKEARARNSEGQLAQRALAAPMPPPLALDDFNIIAELKMRSPAGGALTGKQFDRCLLYTSPSPRDGLLSRMPSSA